MTPKNDELMPGYTAQEDFEGRVVTAIREVLGDMGKIDEYRNKNGSDRQAYMSVLIQEYLAERGFLRAAQGEDEVQDALFEVKNWRIVLAEKLKRHEKNGSRELYQYAMEKDAIYETIERALAHTHTSVSGWADIDNAPKNGDHILVCRWPVNGRWSCNKVYWGSGNFDSKRWLISANKALRYEPTKFHPLPAPPVIGENK